MKLKRNDLINKPVALIRGTSYRLGIITSVGPKKIGVKVLNMKSQTSISLSNTEEPELIPITIYVTPEVYKALVL